MILVWLISLVLYFVLILLLVLLVVSDYVEMDLLILLLFVGGEDFEGGIVILVDENVFVEFEFFLFDDVNLENDCEWEEFEEVS